MRTARWSRTWSGSSPTTGDADVRTTSVVRAPGRTDSHGPKPDIRRDERADSREPTCRLAGANVPTRGWGAAVRGMEEVQRNRGGVAPVRYRHDDIHERHDVQEHRAG